MNSSPVTHAMTIDVEDYYHVAAFSNVIDVQKWPEYPSRVEHNTQRILEIFDENAMKATFFVLGWVAERFPGLVKEIADRGHEVASHGYSHQLIYSQTPEVFREETRRSKEILEEIVQRPVLGYRAASYSITTNSIWALDILADLGFTWDSSIFPIRHDRYGMPSSPEQPYELITSSGRKLIEYPLTTAKVMGLSVPAAGGGYFRQYPYFLSKLLFRIASRGNSLPQIFYLHPWEIDSEQPRIDGASWFSRFRHYTNLDKCEGRLRRIIKDFNFGTMTESLRSIDISTSVGISQLETARHQAS